MDRSEEFVKEIFRYFFKDTSKYVPSDVVKKHSEKLTEWGDYSFPVKPQCWAQFLSSQEYLTHQFIFSCRENFIEKTNFCLDDQIEDLVQTSQKWSLQIDRATLQQDRIVIFVKRFKEFYLTLNSVINDPNYGCCEGEQSYVVIKRGTIPEEKELLTSYRCRVVENVIENLTKHRNGPSRVSLCVTYKSTDVGIPEECTKFFVGPVLDKGDNKMMNIEAADYITKRSVEMQLMAEHKYGLRVKNENFFKNLIKNLGKAAATIDLLEVRPSGAVKLSMSSFPTGCSKGASFILYNSARISTLLKKYEERVEAKYYPETPPLEHVKLELLTEREEWNLLFNYIFGYPSVISRCIGEFHKSKFSLHLLCNFLSGLVATFSVYYGRIRILTDNRPQFMATLHARIYLLKGLQIILHKCLAHLNIDPVEQM